MKSLFTRIVIFFFTLFTGTLHAQTFNWVTGGGTADDLSGEPSNQWEQTRFMCTDANGNLYAISQVGYDPIIADTFSGLAYGSNVNILLTSYNCSGQMRWAKLIATTGGNCSLYGIVADSLGHIYVAGNFLGDGGGGTLHIGYDTTITATSSEYLGTGLIQFDTIGHFNWIRYVGPNTYAAANALSSPADPICIDAENNAHYFCYVTASGIPLMTGVTSTFGTYDLEYNSSGTLLSATRFHLDSSLQPYGATIDKQSGKAYVYGYRNIFIFSDSSYDCFIAAFDVSRNLIWQDTLGDLSGYETQGFSGVAADGVGHIYMSAAGDGDLSYRGYTIVPPAGAAGGYEAIIMKADTSGQMEWVAQCDGNSNSYFDGITLVSGNKIATVGGFDEFASSNTTTGATITIDAGIGEDPLFMVVDTSGALITLQRIHGNSYYDAGTAITSDNIGNIYIGGDVGDTIPDTLIPAYHSIGGNTDFFILKYGIDCSCTSMPVANYSVTGTTTVTFTYTGTTTPAIDSMRWEFGDGGTSTVTNPTYTYTANGTYSACVTVYTGCGSDMHCSDIVITCATPPVASYTYTGTPTVNFTYTGTTSGIDSLVWSFGDGATTTTISPTHTYTAIGTYTVCAAVYTACGNDTFCNTVSIPCLSSVEALYSYTVTAPAVNFTYTGSTTGLDSVRWYFGDGGTSILVDPSYTYTAIGTYSVCVTAYTACGSDTRCLDITIPCVTAPMASFTSVVTAPSVNFNYTGTTAGIDSVRWYFGDGGTSTATDPSYTYTATGTYSVCVTAYSACGSNTYCSEVVIPCIASPAASFTDTGTQTIGFTYTGTTSGIDSMRWYFGDGGTSTTTNPIYTYTAIGTYSVCVAAYSACGADTFCSEVTIMCVSSPIASFTFTGTDTVAFTYTGTTYQIASVLWSYGDGTTDTGVNTTHTYADTGTYTVCVTVYTNCGSDSSCSTIVVSATGIAKLSISNIQVFPNPTTETLNITGLQHNTSYRLLNVTGECVQRGILKQGNSMVSVQSILPGVYILELTGEDGERDMVRVVKE